MLARIGCVLFSTCILLAQDTLNQAWDLAAHQRAPEAIQLLRSLVSRQPSNADARLLLGSLLMEAHQQDESLAQLQAAVRLRPASSEAENALGEAYSNFGNPAAAREAFAKAVRLQPDFGIAQLNLGRTLLELNEPAVAVNPLDRAIRILGHADEAADALYLRARLYASAGEQASAAKLLREAVQIRPGFGPAWSDLGQSRKALLDDTGALTAFQKAVAAKPDDAVAQYRLGVEYLQTGDAHAAAASLRKARQLDPNDQSTLNALQRALRQDGEPAEAAQVKQQLADLLREKDIENQNHLTAIRLNNEGAEKEKAGDLKAALNLYRQAAELYPRHSGILMNYGVALLRFGQWTQGLEELHTAIGEDPDNAKLRAALDDALAQAPAGTRPKWAAGPAR